MKKNKTVFSYVLWLLYALPVVFILGYIIYKEAVIMKLQQQWQLVLAVVVLSVIVFFDYYFISLGIKLSNRTLKKERFYKILEVIVVCAILGGAGLMRSLYIIDSPVLENEALLNASYVTKSGINNLTYGNSILENFMFLYLRGFMMLFGNIERVAFFAVMGLQLFTMLFVYGAVRRMSGKTAGIICITFLGFVPDYLKSVSNISAMHMYLLLLAVILYLIALMIQKDRKTVFKCMLLLVSGVFIGFMIYQDFVSVALVFLGIFLFIENRTYHKVWSKIVSSFGLIVFSVCGIALGILVYSMIFGGRFIDLIYDFGNKILQELNPDIAFISFSSYYSVMFIVVILLAGWCVSFFFVDSKNIYPVYFWVVLEYILMICGYGNTWRGHVLLVGMAILAGINVNMFVKQYEKCKLIEDDFCENDVCEENICDKTPCEEVACEPKVCDTVQLLRNPLPVPKKHVRKELDYAIQVTEDLMHFDVELTDENADYDI